ncbi:Ribokinase-like protein [Xylaria bambusicola]|uniref:Ribokinase-like protein n=1 Tax=Xylaria bambusicola TaxID=326684 RepID=UPI0020073E27|nr:Ribokinase-like protein [Xylaria bambusicola]KAI0509338.1 Ribokinase-like protein [Xylaria bambusicola]
MATKKPLITVLGSLNIDLVSYVSHHPLPGETMTSSSFAVSPGGKGANQAVACAKLSRSHSTSSSPSADETAHIRMVGAVGADSYGSILKENLSSHGVDVSGVVSSPSLKTGIAIIVVDEPTGQNRIILSPEANHSLQPADFAVLPAPKPDLLIMQLEIPLPTVLAALRAARDASVPVLLNPAPAQPLPEDVYQGLAHLVVNETEAAVLGGVSEADLESEAGLESVSKKFLDLGVQNVIVTLGGRGVFYMSASGPKNGLVPAQKAKVVDTTAAGDTFVGQYALDVVGAGTAFDIEAAVRKANRAAAKTVEKLGAQDSIPWRDEL